MNDLQHIFDEQEKFEHMLSKTVGQVDVPEKAATMKHIMEAIYYFQCLNIEFYEYLNAETMEDIKNELVDVLIFAVDVFLFLGVKSKHIRHDLDYYMSKSQEVTEHIIKDSCYGNKILTAIFGKHKSIAEDFITHALASMNIIFSQLLYKNVTYKKWKHYDHTKGCVRDIEMLDKAMEDIFKIVCTLFKVSRVSADEVYRLFLEKRNINVKRQEIGYAEV